MVEHPDLQVRDFILLLQGGHFPHIGLGGLCERELDGNAQLGSSLLFAVAGPYQQQRNHHPYESAKLHLFKHNGCRGGQRPVYLGLNAQNQLRLAQVRNTVVSSGK